MNFTDHFTEGEHSEIENTFAVVVWGQMTKGCLVSGTFFHWIH